MTTPTLESLDGRLERLERLFESRPGSPSFPMNPLPGKGDWEEAFREIDQLLDYDYEALPEQDECDRAEAERAITNRKDLL